MANPIDYASLYYSPAELYNIDPNITNQSDEYTKSLFMGDSSANKISGNRYFIDTQTKCSDISGDMHNRSILIDNMTGFKLSGDNKGLLYSVIASLQNLDSSVIDKSYLSTEHCVPVSVYINSTGDISNAWVTQSDYTKIDKNAISPTTDTPSPTPTPTKSGPNIQGFQTMTPPDKNIIISFYIGSLVLISSYILYRAVTK